MIKLLTVVGARPQFIKAAMFSRSVRMFDTMQEVLVHTGQHFDPNMSDIFFSELKMPLPKYNLGIGGGSHAQNTGRMMEAIELIILNEKPTAVVVFGDTNSTLAAALTAVKLSVPVVHIEAGLRSHNMKMPEEINRRLTDHVSSLLLAPSESAVQKLLKEGLAASIIRNVGDVMFDAAIYFGERATLCSTIIDRLGIFPTEYVLATVHRQENTNDATRLKKIIDAFNSSQFPVVMPMHPRTYKRLLEFEITLPEKVIAIEPLGYLDMIMLEKNARLIATDSGGVQKEAYFHGVPCLTLRNETEWPELVELGWNRIASPDSEDFLDVFANNYSTGQLGFRPYGDGTAANIAVKEIRMTFS